MPKKMTQEQFISRVNEIFGDKYDYSQVEYKNYKTEVKIVCPTHGEMVKKAGLFLSGNGCRGCYEETISERCRMTTDQFIAKAIEKHGNKYDYSVSEYKAAHDKVDIICPEHGIFSQKASGHLWGYGCKECGFDICRTHKKDSLDDFIRKAKSIHGERYSFEKSKYVNSQTKLTVTCQSHGDFDIKPNDVINGIGCAKCAHESNTGCWSIDALSDDQKAIDCVLYHVKITDGMKVFHKVGVTTKSVSNRFRSLYSDGFSFAVISKFKDTLENCLDMEKLILDDLNKDRRLYKVHDLKGTKTGGWTECFYPLNTHPPML